MTESERNKFPDFFEDDVCDPFSAATGRGPDQKPIPKKKAGFYLSQPLLDRFNRHYHQMKLARLPVENKSALLEMALSFALDDLEKDSGSEILKQFNKKH